MNTENQKSSTETPSSQGGVRERISLQVEIKKMVADLRQKRDKAEALSKNSLWGLQNTSFQSGRSKAFDEIASELQRILYAL